MKLSNSSNKIERFKYLFSFKFIMSSNSTKEDLAMKICQEMNLSLYYYELKQPDKLVDELLNYMGSGLNYVRMEGDVPLWSSSFYADYLKQVGSEQASNNLQAFLESDSGEGRKLVSLMFEYALKNLSYGDTNYGRLTEGTPEEQKDLINTKNWKKVLLCATPSYKVDPVTHESNKEDISSTARINICL
jgi:hypothetical protein